jgi:hypothetical protein
MYVFMQQLSNKSNYVAAVQKGSLFRAMDGNNCASKKGERN